MRVQQTWRQTNLCPVRMMSSRRRSSNISQPEFASYPSSMLALERQPIVDALDSLEGLSHSELAQGSRNKRRRPEQPSDTSDDADEDSAPLKRRSVDDAKRKHNVTSQKGRAKINSEIEALKELMPECRGSEFNKARVLHHAVERMRVLITQVEILSKENIRLSKQNEQLWEDLRTGGSSWKASPQSNGTSPVISTTQNMVSTSPISSVSAAAQAQQLPPGAHLLPFLIPTNFASGNYGSQTYMSPAPSSPKPPSSMIQNASSPNSNLNPRQDSESSSATASPTPSLHNHMPLDSTLTRPFLLAPFSNILPNLANAAALSALSQSELHSRSPSNMASTPTLGPLGSLPFLPGLTALPSLPDFMNQSMASSSPLDTSKQPDKLVL